MTLTTPREINAAARAYAYGRARWPPMAELTGGATVRIVRARTAKGVLQVLALGAGRWAPATRAWQDT